jgi:L-lactate utilization protein LutC
MSPKATFDTLKTTSKENMRRKIRHALTQKSTNKFPYIDKQAELFVQPESVTAEFFLNFRNAGGKIILCDKENFIDNLYRTITGQRFNTIFCPSDFLAPALAKKNLYFVTCLDAHQQVDVAIVFTDTLIARTGSMLFTQKFSLYPSVRNITQDIIVVALAKNIVLDLHDAFATQQDKNQGSLYDFAEIITPTKPVNEKGVEKFSPQEPRFILLLIQ